MEKKIELICNVCLKPFLKRFAEFKAQNKVKPQVNYYCSKECQNNRNKIIKHNKSCLHCGKEITANNLTEIKRKKFCNSSCAASYNNIRKPPKQELRVCKRCNKDYPIDKSYDRKECKKCTRITFSEILNGLFCNVCKKPLTGKQKKFCSKKCVAKTIDYAALGKVGGKKSAEKMHKRSKNEILLAEYCSIEFSNVLTNKCYFNGWDADIILPDVKVAILWNGVWHYKKITYKHNLKAVQTRDALKIKEIKKCGYIPYIIKDPGSHNNKFVKEQFEILKKWIQSI